MRRRCPWASGLHWVDDDAVLDDAVFGVSALVTCTGAARMPPDCMADIAWPLTLRLYAVMPRGLVCANWTFARSTAGQWSPLPMVRPTILKVALAPAGGWAKVPFAVR